MTTVIKDKILRSDQSVWDGLDVTTSRKDSTGGTIAGLKIGWEVDVLQAYGNGQNYTKSTIDKALNAIGTTKTVTLIFQPGTWTIDGNLTIGSNFTCRIPNGVLFEVASGKTLTFSGPVIRDGNTWTSGSGTVTESGTRTFTGTKTFTGTTNLGGTLNFTGATSDYTALSLRGYIGGLTLSNNASDATNDIDIAAGMATDSTGVAMLVSTAITKRLDAAWSVGTNQGGLDTGAIANDVYHLWLIRRSDTGVVDVLFSASATAPTMPTSYDQKRRIGAIIRASAAILPFTQFGDNFTLTTPVRDVNSTAPGASAVTRTLASVPDGVKVKAWLNIATFDTGVLESVYVSDLNATDQAPSQTVAPLHSNRSQIANDTAANPVLVLTNTSGQIRTRNSAGGVNSTLIIVTLGWEDYRNKYE